MAAATNPRNERRESGQLIAVAGASQSGKTTWVADRVRACRRLLAWDYKAEWYRTQACERLETLEQLHSVCTSTAAPGRYAYCTTGMNRERFDVWCRFAYVWLRQAQGTLIVEETASVTSSGKAPDGWGDICRMGLGFGAHVYAITQRPAESDKTALGNATLVHCHRQVTEDDVRYIAKLLRVEFAVVDSLLPYQWIERDASGQRRRGGPGVARSKIDPPASRPSSAREGRRTVARPRSRP